MLGQQPRLLGVDVPKYLDLSGGPKASNEERYTRTLEALRDNPDTLLDHPMLRLEVAGRRVYLEPDLVAFQLDDRYHVVEIKSFPVIDEQADPGKVSAAATQAAVYVLALREALAEAGRDPESVSHEVLLVCPKDFSNQPVSSMIDVRRQLSVLRRQLSRMARIEQLLDTLPEGITFDLEAGDDGAPARDPEDLRADVAAYVAQWQAYINPNKAADELIDPDYAAMSPFHIPAELLESKEYVEDLGENESMFQDVWNGFKVN